MAANQPSDMMPLEDFIALPDTASFVIRYNSLVEKYVSERPYIRLGNLLTGNFAVAYVQRDLLDQILEDLGISNISLVLGILSQIDLEASGITPVQRQPYLSLRGSQTLIAFIDTGIDYTTKAFQYGNKTSRIQYIWDQTIRGTAPKGYPFGTEYTNAQINEALQSEDPYSIVPHQDRVGHGTFLASVAASNEEGTYLGVAPESELIVVKLKKAGSFYLNRFLVPKEQENVFESSDLMLGIEYAIEKAIELDRPLSICIGLGTNLGGHDGYTLLEDYLARISYMVGITICSAAGNESNAKHHIQGTISNTGESKNVEIDAGTSGNDIYISLWNGPSDRFSVSVRSPTGEVVGRIPARSGTNVETRLVLELSTVIIQYIFPIEGSGSQLTTIKFLKPTPGIWTVTIYGDTVLDGTFNAWLPITDFVSPDVMFLSAIPSCTITVPATAVGVITCGAYSSLNNSLYVNSSWGPTRLPMMSPDFVAPGVDVEGISPSGYAKMSGTGVATAFTAGACALLLQWGVVEGNNRLLNTYLTKTLLIRGCERDEGIVYPNIQWGYGRINLLNTLQSIRVT